MKKKSEPVVLAHGPDTVYYNIRPTDRQFHPVREELDITLQEELEALKRLAQDRDEFVPTRWVFSEQTLMMRDKGGSQFKWVMENDAIILAVGRGKRTGIVGQVRLNSEYLWGCRGDLGLALTQVHLFLEQVYGKYFVLELSSLDLAADILHLDLSAANIKECFISRAIIDNERPAYIDDGFIDGPSDIRRRWKKIAGLSFGMHTSATSGVIYNKTDEIKYHSQKKRWMQGIWKRRAEDLGVEYREDMPVHRVEIRYKRTAIREFPSVSGAYDALDALQRFWSYGVGHIDGGDDGLPDGWLRYVVPSKEKNRSRWLVHPAWVVVQGAFDPVPLPESSYEREEREKEEWLSLADEELEAHPWKEESSLFKRHPRTRKNKASVPIVPAAPGPDKPLSALPRFIRQRKREVNMERGIAQIIGWLSTVEAWRQNYEVDGGKEIVENDISCVLHFILEQSEEYLQEKMVDFAELVREKRKFYRLEPVGQA